MCVCRACVNALHAADGLKRICNCNETTAALVFSATYDLTESCCCDFCTSALQTDSARVELTCINLNYAANCAILHFNYTSELSA